VPERRPRAGVRPCAQVTHVVNKLNEARAVAPNNEPYHLGLGNGDGVPAYLRTEEVGVRIRNRRMPKRDVEYFVGQVSALPHPFSGVGGGVEAWWTRLRFPCAAAARGLR
jgi:hypothetical protein